MLNYVKLCYIIFKRFSSRDYQIQIGTLPVFPDLKKDGKLFDKTFSNAGKTGNVPEFEFDKF